MAAPDQDEGVLHFQPAKAGMNLFNRLFPADRLSRAAVLFEDRRLTYAELRDETVRLGEVLHALGVRPGDRVAILLADSPEFIASFVAIISIGAIAVPINLALSREVQLFILQDCDACAAVAEARMASSLFVDSSPNELQNVIVVRRPGDERALVNAEVRILDVKDAPLSSADDGAPPDGRASDTHGDAFILYTSGSTGEPKGAVHTEADIFYTNETYCREVLNLRPGDR